jgi:hypothetical protein
LRYFAGKGTAIGEEASWEILSFVPPDGHGAARLQSIYDCHRKVLDGVAAQEAALAMNAMSEHFQFSQRERLNKYDRWRCEATLLQRRPSMFDSYAPAKKP